MFPLDERLKAVFLSVWPLLPALKSKAYLTGIGLEDLGAKHGSYDPETGTISLNYRLLGLEEPQTIPLFDINGDSPPKSFPCVSRISHTLIHEIFHAIGTGTGCDLAPAWLALSGWTRSPENPQGTGRYYEHRPGWSPMGPSDWRYSTNGTFFVRDYSSLSPHEDQADTCAHITLGWHDQLNAPESYRANALAKLAYLRRHLWGERGVSAVHAAAQRWHAAHRPSQPPTVPGQRPRPEGRGL